MRRKFILRFVTVFAMIFGVASVSSDAWAVSPSGMASDTEVESIDSENTSGSAVTADPSIWKYTRRIMIGGSFGELDRKRRYGGVIKSRWGVGLKTGRNIYVHRKPIAGFMRIGIDVDLDMNYMNMAKGTGSLSDAWNHPEDDMDLGEHYLTLGVAVGPNITFAPFSWSANQNLRSLRFRPYFHLTPSYATYIVANSDDGEFHNAFALWCSAGLEIQWKRLLFGLEWKGSTAKYKGMVDSLLAEDDEDYVKVGSHKFDCNMFNISIGLAF